LGSQNLFFSKTERFVFNFMQKLNQTGWFILVILYGIHVAAAPVPFYLQGAVSGKITDAKSGLPLPETSVYFPDLKKGTAVLPDGHYEINNLPEGTYLVEISHVGYKTITRNIKITGSTQFNFALMPSVVEENAVVVTGSTKATLIKRNPVAITVVNKQFLQQNLSTNIIDAISRVPGISAVTTGPNISKPFIRGLGYNRILTLFDGVRNEGQQWGDEHGIEVDQNSVERVEVIKGPASLIYGADALAGVVNLIPANFPASGKNNGQVSTAYHSNNGLMSFSGMVNGTQHDWVWRGRVSYKQATDYRNKIDGRVFNTGFRESDLNGMLGINKKWGYMHLGFSFFNDLQEVPDGSRDSVSRKFTRQISEIDNFRPIVTAAESRTYKIAAIHQLVQNNKFYMANNFNLKNGSRIHFNAGYQKSVRKEFSHPAVKQPGLYLQLQTGTYDIKYNFKENKNTSYTAGINGMYQLNQVEKGTEFVIPSYRQFDFGPFLFIKKTIRKIELAGGLRYDIRTLKMASLFTKQDLQTGFDKPVTGLDTIGANRLFTNSKMQFSGITVSVGVSFIFTDAFSMKFNMARGFRTPNIAEIASNGVHPGTNIYQLGNTRYKPEFSLQQDLGFIYHSEHLTMNLEVFNNEIQNYVFNEKLLNKQGTDSIMIAGNQTFQFRQAKARLYGAEYSMDIHPHPLDWLHIENSISFTFGKRKTANDKPVSDSAIYLPQIPPVHSFSEIRANINNPFSGLMHFFVKLQIEWNAAQHRVLLENNTETRTPGYILYNLGLGTDFSNKKKQPICSISLIVNNIFNTSYQSHLNRLKYFEPYPGNASGTNGIYNMGRNIAVQLRVPFNFTEK
jgi:iron complex outermembrane receptor protein